MRYLIELSFAKNQQRLMELHGIETTSAARTRSLFFSQQHRFAVNYQRQELRLNDHVARF